MRLPRDVSGDDLAKALADLGYRGGRLTGCAAATSRDVLTGPELDEGAPGARLPLETSVPGVFAIGDVRGSVKRVGGTAAVVVQLYSCLVRQRRDEARG